MKYIKNTAKTWMHMDKSNIYFSSGKKLRENARWNVNKTIRYLVRNKIKHRKKYKIGKSPTPLGKISIVLFTRLAELENDSLSCTFSGV